MAEDVQQEKQTSKGEQAGEAKHPKQETTVGKWIAYLVPVFCVVVAVLLYFFIPDINAWVLHISKGLQGGAILAGCGVLLAIYYAVVMGFRGKKLVYAIGVILFTIFCIWMLANIDEFTYFLREHLGTWGAVGVMIGLCIVVWLGTKMI